MSASSPRLLFVTVELPNSPKIEAKGVVVTPQKYPRIFIIILLYIPGIN